MGKIKRAVILAAGKGTRMYPITQETPKPLVKVNGVRMIDSSIRALRENGINEIYVVVGFLKERFSCLEKEYPGLKLIENPYYNSCNNISSLYVARNYLEDCIILDGDQLIYNPQVLSPIFDASGYNCVWINDKTDEWILYEENGIVKSCSKGGEGGWRLFSISKWTASDGKKLRRHLEIEFEERENRQIYWDDIALFCYPKEYQLQIYEMKSDDVVEIDSLSEIAAIDESYKIYLSGEKKK